MDSQASLVSDSVKELKNAAASLLNRLEAKKNALQRVLQHKESGSFPKSIDFKFKLDFMEIVNKHQEDSTRAQQLSDSCSNKILKLQGELLEHLIEKCSIEVSALRKELKSCIDPFVTRLDRQASMMYSRTHSRYQCLPAQMDEVLHVLPALDSVDLTFKDTETAIATLLSRAQPPPSADQDPLPFLTQPRPEEHKDNGTMLPPAPRPPQSLIKLAAHQAARCIWPLFLFRQKAAPIIADAEFDFDLVATFKEMKIEEKQQAKRNAMDLEADIPDEVKFKDLIDQRLKDLGITSNARRRDSPSNGKQGGQRKTNNDGNQRRNQQGDQRRGSGGRQTSGKKNGGRGQGANMRKTTPPARGNNRTPRPSTSQQRRRANSTSSQPPSNGRTNNTSQNRANHNTPRGRARSSSFHEGAAPHPPDSNRNNRSSSHKRKHSHTTEDNNGTRGKRAETLLIQN